MTKSAPIENVTPLAISDGNFVIKIPQYVRAAFEPKEDITAYELATMLMYFVGGKGMTEDDWEKLGVAQRHLRRI